MDLHCDQIQGFYNIPANNLFARRVLTEQIRIELGSMNYSKEVTVVSPDAGGVSRARAVADILGTNVVTIMKRRSEANQVSDMEISGKSNDTAIIVDDMIDTGGTLCKAATMLKETGVRRVITMVSHGLFSDGLDKIHESAIDLIFTTDTVQHNLDYRRYPKLKVISVAPLFAQAIKNIHEEKSLSILFQ